MIHLTGQIEINGQIIPVDLSSDSRTGLAGALLALIPVEEAGVVRGQTAAPQAERFSRGRQRSNGDADPLELRAHPYDWITQDRLTGNPDIDMGLIGLRYPWLSYTIDPRHIAAAERYLAGDEAAADPFEADVARLRALPQDELIKTDGSLNLSAVARAVGRRTGGSDWAYVQELAAALGERAA